MAMDLELIVPTRRDEGWMLDIDIVGGIPGTVSPENTPRQRAAVAAYILLGSIPGQSSIGVDWGGYASQKVSLIDIDNQIKKSIQDKSGNGGEISSQLIPLYELDESGSLQLKLWDLEQQKEQAS